MMEKQRERASERGRQSWAGTVLQTGNELLHKTGSGVRGLMGGLDMAQTIVMLGNETPSDEKERS